MQLSHLIKPNQRKLLENLLSSTSLSIAISHRRGYGRSIAQGRTAPKVHVIPVVLKKHRTIDPELKKEISHG